MDEKAKEARNKYLREWKRANKDKVKQYDEKYWMKKAGLLDDQTKCEYCDKPFESKRKGTKFCSTKCRVDYHRKNKNA